MKSKQTKKKTTGLIDVMIQHADKGASGFWTDDYEGCGNPKYFQSLMMDSSMENMSTKSITSVHGTQQSFMAMDMAT